VIPKLPRPVNCIQTVAKRIGFFLIFIFYINSDTKIKIETSSRGKYWGPKPIWILLPAHLSNQYGLSITPSGG